jgi:uncharacterized protein
MDTKYFIIGGAFLVVVLLLGFSVKSLVAGPTVQSSTETKNNDLGANVAVPNTNLAGTNNNPTNVQVVKLHVQGGSYVLEPSKLKKGIPVRLEADMSRMPGCSKDVVISAFGVRKYFTQGDNVVEFTPDKTGTINIACSMNMYRGTFEVVNPDGTSDPNAVVQSQNVPVASGGSCGASGGGCGCGG